jgi:hypothetical protein
MRRGFRLPCIQHLEMVNSLCAVGDGRANLCSVREPAILLTNRWSTRWEPIMRPALASPPKDSGIQKPALRRPLVIAGSQKRRHGTGGGFFLRCANLPDKGRFLIIAVKVPISISKNTASSQPPQTRELMVEPHSHWSERVFPSGCRKTFLGQSPRRWPLGDNGFRADGFITDWLGLTGTTK